MLNNIPYAITNYLQYNIKKYLFLMMAYRSMLEW